MNGVFTIITASGGKEHVNLRDPNSPHSHSYFKNYWLLRTRLMLEEYQGIVDVEREVSVEHQMQLNLFLNELSDAEFELFVKILVSSPTPRHRLYLGICAMLPSDLGMLRYFASRHREGLFDFHVPPQLDFLAPPGLYSMTLHVPRFPFPPSPTAAVREIPEAQSRSRREVHVSFSVEDVDGAADLLLKIALNTQESGLDLRVATLVLLQRFASLARTVSQQLSLKWMSKWPLDWEGVDHFTLDLRKAYAPDGTYIPSKEWLEGLNRVRNVRPGLLSILAPTKEAEADAYNAFGIDIFPSLF